MGRRFERRWGEVTCVFVPVRRWLPAPRGRER